MILSTLPDIPGRNYDVIGVVLRNGRLYKPQCDDKVCDSVLTAIMKQATSMGADAIVDVKIITGVGHTIVVSGTAVKLR